MTEASRPVLPPHDELAALVADLRAATEWAARCGAVVLPREEVSPPALPPVARSGTEPRPGGRPVGADGARSGPGPERPVREGRAPLLRPVSDPAPRVARREPTSPTPPARPPRSPAPQGQLALGRWERFKAGASAPAPSADPGLAGAGTIDAIRQALGECERCALSRGRSRIVFGVGSPRARLMIIGEAPGFHEDRQGEPFVGKAGEMLDRMLANVLGLQREEVYITNVVKCRPPDNRNPQGEEIARCAPFLQAQLRVVSPPFVLVLGSVAARTVLQTTSGVKRLRGQWHDLRWEAGQARAMVTFHPAYLLRQPQDKRLTFQDLQEVRRALDAGS